MLIGLCGQAYSGKSTLANYLIEQGFQRMAFGDGLKEMLIKAGMCNHHEVYSEKTMLSRWLMQKVGTEIFRNQIDKDFWIKLLNMKLQAYDYDFQDNIVIDDIRMPNEAAMVRSNGGFLIRVKRLNYTPKNIDLTHESESQIDSIECDVVLAAESGEVGKLKHDLDYFLKGIKNG